MCNSTNELMNGITPRGLYRVWLQTYDNRTPHLVSVWIDPALRAFEPRMAVQEADIAVSLVRSSDDEPPGWDAEDDDALVILDQKMKHNEFQ